MQIEGKNIAPKVGIIYLPYVTHGRTVIGIRRFVTIALSRYQAIGTLVVTIGDEGSHSQRVGRRGDRSSHRLESGSVCAVVTA